MSAVTKEQSMLENYHVIFSQGAPNVSARIVPRVWLTGPKNKKTFMAIFILVIMAVMSRRRERFVTFSPHAQDESLLFLSVVQISVKGNTRAKDTEDKARFWSGVYTAPPWSYHRPLSPWSYTAVLAGWDLRLRVKAPYLDPHLWRLGHTCKEMEFFIYFCVFWMTLKLY